MAEQSAVQTNTESAAAASDDSSGILGGSDTSGTDDTGVLGGDDNQGDQTSDANADDKAGDNNEAGGDDNEDNDKKDGVPEKYEFTLPDGRELNQEAMDLFDPVLRDLGLSNENAQKLAGALDKYQQVQEESVAQFYADQKAEALKIPAAEIGLAKQALNLFPDEAKAIKDDIYMRDNPAVIRLLSKFGKLAAEAKFREGANKQSTGPLSFEERANKMYGKS